MNDRLKFRKKVRKKVFSSGLASLIWSVGPARLAFWTEWFPFFPIVCLLFVVCMTSQRLEGGAVHYLPKSK